MSALKALLSVAAIGAGIYAAMRLTENAFSVSYEGDAIPPYDPYSTNDPNTTYAGMITPMDKQRFSPRTLNTSGQELGKIAQFEGRRSTAYPDSDGNLTIGIGHKIIPGDGLTENSSLSDAQINSLYANDIANAETSVYSRVKVPLSQGEFDALVDFAFQFGDSKLGSSTLLRLLNAGNYNAAVSEFSKWINVGNKPNASLVARRADDANTFLT